MKYSPGRVEFFEQVQGVVAARRGVALLDAVERRGGQRDLAFLAVDLLHLDDFGVPVVAPVAVKPDAGRDVPARRPVARVLEHAADGSPCRRCGDESRGR